MYDKEIRESLFFFLEEVYGKCRIIEEKVIGKARADSLLITEEAFIGVEIKSDHDSYQRLRAQVENYDIFFDYNILVVGTKHAGSAWEHVPSYWGIITVEEVDGKADFYFLRREKRNPKRDLIKKGSLLWKEELIRLLEGNGFPLYKQKSKKFQFAYLLSHLPEEQLERAMADCLLEREYPEEKKNPFLRRRKRKRRMLPKLRVSHIIRKRKSK